VCEVGGRAEGSRASPYPLCMHAYPKILNWVARKRSSGERKASHKEATWDLIRCTGLGLWPTNYPESLSHAPWRAGTYLQSD